MTIVVRLLALALLLAGGYAAYARARAVLSLVENGAEQSALLGSVNTLLLDGVFILCTVAMALMVLIGRKSAARGGEKARFRFGGLARFFAAIALFSGVRFAVSGSLNFYRIWSGDLLDQVLARPDGARVLGIEGLALVVGLVSIVLALMVLFAPRPSVVREPA